MIKKVAVINDLSGFGKCSLTASIAILSAMGVQPCPMPTAVLTNQSGFKNHSCVDLTDSLHTYIDMWQKNGEGFDGIYSGYVANGNQIEIIAEFIKTFRNSYNVVLVDPVMGDNGRIYKAYNKTTCDKMCGLVKSADIVTPNLTELCIISGVEYNSIIKKQSDENYLEIISDLAHKSLAHCNQKFVVTGIKSGDCIYNGIFSKNQTDFVKSKIYGDSFSGTGDIFASIICAAVVSGASLNDAAKKAAGFLEKVIADTIKEPYDPNYGINFEKFICELSDRRS